MHQELKEPGRLEDNLLTLIKALAVASMEMLGELIQIETPIWKAKELINGIYHAVDGALENGQELDENIIMELSDEVEKSHLPPYYPAGNRI